MTVQEIKDLNNIKYPNDPKADSASYIEEHKVNDYFIIVTGPIGCGKFAKYYTKSEVIYKCENILQVSDLITDFEFKDKKPTFFPSDFTKCSAVGGTVILYDLNLLSDKILEFLLEATDPEKNKSIHPDFKIIGIMTPGYYLSKW